MSEINQGRAEALANKLDKLNEFFDITESTVSEISKHLEIEVTNTEIIIEEDEDTDQIIDIKTLKEDFKTIRNTLLDTIDNGKKVIGAITANISDLGGIDDPDLVSAYASLVGTVNNSLKLLTETYKNILSMQKMINESKKDNSPKTINNTVNINTVNATVDEIIKSMGKEYVLESK